MELVEHLFEDKKIIRRADGFWNIALMCKQYNKQSNDFFRLKSTKEYLSILSEDLQVPVYASSITKEDVVIPVTNSQQEFDASQNSVTGIYGTEKRPKFLVEIIQGGTPELQGTWGHDDVAIEVAGWLDPRFRLWMNRTIKKLLIQGYVALEEEIEALKSLYYSIDRKFEELSIEQVLLEHQNSRLKYENDELLRDMHWHRANSWGGQDG